ncbi:MAG: serine hydrolase [Bacteroidia bacterium]|nr:serine hydrolase [Bacteroidia bacterium]
MKSNILPVFFILILLLPSLAPAQKKGKKTDAQILDEFIAKSVKDLNLAGASVAIIKDGNVVLNQGYGLANPSDEVKTRSSDLFNIASCSKAFTTACLGILVEEGKLSWDDYVIDYIPGFRLEDPWVTAQFTVTDLVTHRSGLTTFMGDLLWYETDYSNDEIIRRMRFLPQDLNYRKDYGYQNNTFMIAGEIIKKVSGQSWGQFLKSHILDPLDMTHTRLCGNDVKASDNLAWPQIAGTQIDYFHGPEHPAASLFSSTDDMSHWVSMLLNNGTYNGKTILKPETLERIWTSETIEPTGAGWNRRGVHFRTYALGWGLFDYSGKMVIEHSGGMPGYISKVFLVPEVNLGAVILTNDMDGGYLTSMLRYHLLDHYIQDKGQDYLAEFVGYRQGAAAFEADAKAKFAATQIKGTSPGLPLADFTGTYVDKMYGKATVELRDGELELTLLPAKDIFNSEMEHWHYNTFKIQFKDPFMPPGLVTFHLGHNGKVEHFTITIDIADFHFYNLDFRKVEEE